jgi:hypothetical protein
MESVNRKKNKLRFFHGTAYKPVVGYKKEFFGCYHRVGIWDTTNPYFSFQQKEEMHKLFIVRFKQAVFVKCITPEPG